MDLTTLNLDILNLNASVTKLCDTFSESEGKEGLSILTVKVDTLNPISTRLEVHLTSRSWVRACGLEREYDIRPHTAEDAAKPETERMYYLSFREAGISYFCLMNWEEVKQYGLRLPAKAETV